MLGEQYAELKGKITSQRVLDVDEGPIIETSTLINGTMKGINVQEMVSFTDTSTAEKEELFIHMEKG